MFSSVVQCYVGIERVQTGVRGSLDFSAGDLDTGGVDRGDRGTAGLDDLERAEQCWGGVSVLWAGGVRAR